MPRPRRPKPGLLPTSGSEPTNFSYYRTPKAVIRNNCMAFAFGERGQQNYVKQQPGNKSGLKGVDFSLATCDALVERVQRDYKKTVYKARAATPCKRGYSKVMAFLAPNADFHFYRQGPTGYWEHKRGLTPPTTKDACGKRIKNPLKACRNYGDSYDYKEPCATFCRLNKTHKKKKA